MRFVAAPARRARPPADRHHGRRVRADAARAVERGRDEPRRAGGRRPRRGRGVRAPLRPRQAAARSATCSTSTTSLHGDLGQSSLTHDAVTHDLGTVHPGDGRARALLDALRRVRRRRVRRHRGAAPQPADRPRAPRRLARRASRCRRSGSRSSRSTSASTGSTGSRAPAGSTRASTRRRSITGLYTIDALLARRLRPLRAGAPPPHAAGARARRVQRQPADAVHALGGARGDRATTTSAPARAKGMPERDRRPRYILRAALPSVVTVLGLVFANVLTGAVLVEKIFSWPGIGQYAYQAAVNLDVPGDRGRQPVRRGRLRHGQLHRRRPLRRHRPEDPAHVTRRRRRRRGAAPALRDLARPGASRSRSSGVVIAVALDRDRDLRAADRAARPARAERSRRAQARRGRTCSAPTSSAATSSAA